MKASIPHASVDWLVPILIGVLWLGTKLAYVGEMLKASILAYVVNVNSCAFPY